MTLWVLILLSFLHVVVWVAFPVVFFIVAFKLPGFELSQSETDIGLALWGASSISMFVSIVLVSKSYLAGGQASDYWWFAMPWAFLAVLIVYLIKVSKVW